MKRTFRHKYLRILLFYAATALAGFLTPSSVHIRILPHDFPVRNFLFCLAIGGTIAVAIMAVCDVVIDWRRHIPE
jgi:hypothetical protein